MHRVRKPSELASFVAGRQQFLKGNSAGTLAKVPDASQSFIDFFLMPVHLGHNPGDPAPVAGDDQCFAPFHIIEEFGKMNLRF